MLLRFKEQLYSSVFKHIKSNLFKGYLIKLSFSYLIYFIIYRIQELLRFWWCNDFNHGSYWGFQGLMGAGFICTSLWLFFYLNIVPSKKKSKTMLNIENVDNKQTSFLHRCYENIKTLNPLIHPVFMRSQIVLQVMHKKALFCSDACFIYEARIAASAGQHG